MDAQTTAFDAPLWLALAMTNKPTPVKAPESRGGNESPGLHTKSLVTFDLSYADYLKFLNQLPEPMKQ
jgi:hypothetical protein